MHAVKPLITTNKTLTRHGAPIKFKEGLYSVGKSAYAWMVPNGAWGETNIGLIDCGGKSVLIDTCWDLHFTQEMLTATQPIIQKSPIDIVINTHSDGDHCWGNQLFKQQEIIATQACIDQIHHHPPKSINALKLGCKAFKHLPFLSLDTFAGYVEGMFGPYDFKPIDVTAPNSGFTDERCINVNGVDIVVIEVGPAHTDGDALVHVPDQSVVYAGDLVFIDCTPVMWSGPVDSIVAGLQKLLSLNAQTIVPGHGPLASREQVQLLIEYWHFIHEQIYKRFQVGMEPFKAAFDLYTDAAFRQSPFAKWAESERLMTNAYTLYRNWGVNVSSLPAPLNTLDMLRRQSTLVAHACA